MAISNASNQIVEVNLIPGIVPSVLHLSQYDTGAGRPITFSVYDGSQAFTIPSGVSIAFEGTKPDGKGFSFTCSKSGSNALLTNYTNQMTALPGKIMCQLVFTDTSGGRVGSLPVLMVVTPAGINGDTVISDSDIEAIVAAQNQYAVLNARLDAAIDQVNTTAANAKASETAAKASETNAASSATEAQGYADSALTAATNAAGYVGEAEYRLMINPETGHMALAHYTKDVAIITVNHSGAWTSTTVNGSTMYAYSVGLSAVYADVPTVSLAASGSNALPTAAEQTAYALIQYATVDADTKTLKLYATAQPASDFVINVEGVKA